MCVTVTVNMDAKPSQGRNRELSAKDKNMEIPSKTSTKRRFAPKTVQILLLVCRHASFAVIFCWATAKDKGHSTNRSSE